MGDQDGWIRARQPEQVEARRASLLQACRELLQDRDPLELRVRALAERAGMSGSGVYRYFDNMEAILLAVHRQDLVDMVHRWCEDANVARGDLRILSTRLASSMLQEPRLLPLAVLTPTLLERTVSLQTMREHKFALIELMQASASALIEGGLHVQPELAVRTVGRMLAFAIGLHPLANPTYVAAEALQDPALTVLSLDMVEELQTGFEVILRGTVV